MKFMLYNGTYLKENTGQKDKDGKPIKKDYEFKDFDSFEERLKEIQDKVLHNEDYGKYYTECEYQNIEKVENALKFLTSYILGAKNYSTCADIKRYLELKKKSKNKTIDTLEKSELSGLKKQVLFDNDKFIFFENIAMEKKLEKVLKRLKRKPVDDGKLNNSKIVYRDSTEQFMIGYLEGNSQRKFEGILNFFERCKQEVQGYKIKIQKAKEDIIKNKSQIGNDYNLYKDSKEKSLLGNVDGLVTNINQAREEIRHYTTKIKELYEDYLVCTELQYKTK